MPIGKTPTPIVIPKTFKQKCKDRLYRYYDFATHDYTIPANDMSELVDYVLKQQDKINKLKQKL